MRMVKGILIDPFARTITEVEHDGDDPHGHGGGGMPQRNKSGNTPGIGGQVCADVLDSSLGTARRWRLGSW